MNKLSELYWTGMGYEYPKSAKSWEYSTTLNKWGRVVTFNSGMEVFSYPKIPRRNKQGEYPGVFEFNLDNIICRRICGVDNYYPFNPAEILHSDHEKFNWLSVFMGTVGKGARRYTKEKLERAFMDCFSRVKTCALFPRLVFNIRDCSPLPYYNGNGCEYTANGCEYTAGQDYQTEMALIRKIIAQNY